MKKILSIIIILALMMSLSTFIAASATTLIAPTRVVTFTSSGPSNAPSAWTYNDAPITRQQYDAEINRIYQGATERLISFDVSRRSGTTENGMTRAAAISRLQGEQAPWGAEYLAALNRSFGNNMTDFTWAGNSVSLRDITGNGTPDLIFAAGDSLISFFVYSFDGTRANRIIYIEHLEAHVSNNNHDVYFTRDGTLIVRGGNGGDDGHGMFSRDTFHIFGNLAPSTPPSPTPSSPISVYFDGTRLSFDVPPQMIDGRVLVPLRTIFEALGADVNWNEATRTITATRDDTTVVLTIGNTTATVNGQSITLDVPPQVIDGRTLVPLRFVAESFGVTVDWNGETRTVTISSLPTGATPSVPPQTPPPQTTGLAINPEPFDIMGMTFNQIVSRQGSVVSEDWFMGSYVYRHENGLGYYAYFYSQPGESSRPIESESDRANSRLFVIHMRAQNLFLNSFETLNRNDFQEAFGVTVSEIWRNEMDDTYGFSFTYRNVIVAVPCERDGTVRSNSAVGLQQAP
ncbi:MAG: copper amine oxidase N-terminal domain-containing protein [Oscillospiraceae bacterium]|nr:copper amine oxidase N-terminal domain-containing protein [Oscillospiraceae bacterium]